MTQSFISVVFFLLLILSAPLVLKWLRQQALQKANDFSSSAKVVSAVAVGPQQRVVTVELGAVGARVRLTLGVTAQSVTLLHTHTLPGALDGATANPVAVAALGDGTK